MIAEISTNHANDIKIAKNIIVAAARSGATAIKLQTFTAEMITVKSSNAPYKIPSSSPLWSGHDLFELMREAETPLAWHFELFEFAKKLGLDAFSTPYHPSSVGFLVDLGVSALKVSSFDVINHPLLREIANASLPVIMSVGMSSQKEIDEAVEILSKSAKSLILLKCTSSYPCDIKNTNLLGISTLKSRYGLEVGFSDHTIGITAALVAIGLGATVFEKHVRSEENNLTLDSQFSIDPNGFTRYVASLNQAADALGDSELKLYESERASFWERPSLIALKDIRLGEVFSDANVGVRRPSAGLPPRRLFDVLGRESAGPLFAGEGITEQSVRW